MPQINFYIPKIMHVCPSDISLFKYNKDDTFDP